MQEIRARPGTLLTMRFTRHVPEVKGVLTLHHDPDGWRAELTHGACTDLAPLPRPSAPEALDALGLDATAGWATELAETARRRLAADAAVTPRA